MELDKEIYTSLLRNDGTLNADAVENILIKLLHRIEVLELQVKSIY